MADSKSWRRAVVLGSAVGPLFTASALAGPTLATADGFGANVTGGGGVGDVYHVTTLASDPTGVLPGSLRYGLYYKNFATEKVNGSSVYGKRTIVFDVGGTLDLGSTTLDLKDVGNVTLAGQTAPSPVVITGNTVQITGTKTSNVILQYVTIRNPSAGEDSLSIKGSGPTTNILADHISTSWGKDEQISVTQGATNVTVQNSFATEALDSASHAYGSLIRPEQPANVSYLKNLYSNNRSRNPRPGSYDQMTLNFDFRNNVVYNYSDRAGYTGGEGHDVVNLNYAGNYVIAGPYTTQAASATAFTVDNSGDGVNLVAYQNGNFVDSNGWGATLPGLKDTTSAGKVTYGKNSVRDGSDLNWGAFTQLTGGTSGFFTQAVASPFAVTAKFATDATTAYQQVLASGGNFAWNRDATDARLVAEIKAGTGDVKNAAPAGELAAVQANIAQANWTSRAAGYDTDNDGLPNAWELQHGLNPASTTVQLHFNATSQKVTTATSGFEGWTGGESNLTSPNGYSWLEVYLSELGLQATYAGSGAWENTLAWNGVLPDAVGATATFNNPPAGVQIEISGAHRVGQLNFTGGGTTLFGAGGLTTQVVAGYAIVSASGGAHTIGVPLTLASDTHFAVGAAATLDLTGGLNAAGRVVTKEAAGTLVLNNVRAAGLNVAGGVVKIRAGASPNAITGTSALGSLAVAAGSQLDLTNNALVMTYGTGGGAATTAAVRGLLQSGKLTSSTATANVGLGYGDDGAGQVAVKTALFGDADLDGGVSINDFNALAGNFGQAAGKLWVNGDFDYDGGVSINDFNKLAANFGRTLGGGGGGGAAAVDYSGLLAFAAAHDDLAAFAAVTGVPEPAALGLVAVAGTLTLRRRR